MDRIMWKEIIPCTHMAQNVDSELTAELIGKYAMFIWGKSGDVILWMDLY